MSEQQYEFDKGSFSFKKPSKWKTALMTALKVMLYALALMVVSYTLFALVINTDTERRLKRENRMYAKIYPELGPKETLLRDAISVLEVKDDSIYEEVFHSTAPSVDPINSLDFLFGADTIPETSIVAYTYAKAKNLRQNMLNVDENFMRILVNASRSDKVLPPMALPVQRVSYTQIGASKGEKLNPFLRAAVEHNGIDFIVPQGSPVFASADGEITNVVKSSKGMGNLVEIAHEGGYVTRYAHLSSSNVKKGQKVEKGHTIGTVGMSGSAFAPHLHYEVILDGVPMDPVNYIFASVTPEEYTNMLYVATHTEQSLD